MTVLIWAIDGLDAKYVHEHALMEALEPQELHQDLSGANALFTYRVWPAIWTGVNGGKSKENHAARFYPEKDPIWDRYSSVVALAPWVDGLYSQHQTYFDANYRESMGPADRIDDQFDKYWRIFDDFRAGPADLLVFGTRLPDILGHMDSNRDRIARRISQIAGMAEKMASEPEIDDYLVVSDHGFEYREYGKKPSGVEAHSRRATLASSFASDYDQMSDFIEGWTDDLDEAVRQNQLKALGYR